MTTKIRPLLKDVVDLLSCSHAFPDVPSTIVSLLLALLDSGARDASLTLHTSPHSFDVATASWPHGCDPVVDDLLAALSVLSCSVTIRTFAPYHESRTLPSPSQSKSCFVAFLFGLSKFGRGFMRSRLKLRSAWREQSFLLSTSLS